MKKTYLLLLVITVAILSGCQHDTFGNLFTRRETLTFRVQSENRLPLEGVCLMTIERDAFDNDPIVGRTNYTYTDENGFVTVKAAYDEVPGYSNLNERTTSFTFTADGYADYDTIFNYWEDTVDIVLYRE